MARVLPSGRVTFAFTDVVGSTRAFAEHGQAYAEALPAVQRVIAECTGAQDGVVVKTEGDGAFLAFPSAAGAVRALVAALQALETEPAGGPWLRIRAGAHTAEAEPVGDDYLALGVHVAARVSAAAGAGQLLVTPAVVGDLDDADRAAAVDVGSFELKDLPEPVRLWRLHGDDSPPGARPARRTNVADPITSFVGREVEIDELDRLLEDPGLVTVVGAGGTGKTRLASEYALRRAPERDGGIWLVELAAVTAPDQVLTAVAQVLGLPGVPSADTVAADLRRRGDPLLVLDNCEHVADAAADLVDELLTRLPGLRVLATSREPLELPGERVQRLGPLPTPTELFADRARAAGAEPSAADADAVREICDLLDGLPLAVELAAARTATLAPRDLLDALRQGDIALRRRGGPERQRNLESLVGWSLDLLDRPHRDALLVLSVVPDRFSAEMARTVLGAVPGLPSVATAELARRSLVDLDGAEYRMLVTIRDVGRTELAARPELRAAALGALFAWAVDRAEQHDTLDTIEAWEARAMQTALEWAVPRRLDGCGRVMRELARWAVSHTRQPGAIALAEQVLAGPDPVAPDEVRLWTACIRLLGGLGYSASVSLETGRALVAAARASGDRDALRYAASVVPSVLVRAGHSDEALALQQEALELTGHRALRAACLVDLGTIHHMRGELDAAERIYREALTVTPRGNVNWVVCMGNLGEVLLDAGRHDEAAEQLRAAVRDARGFPVLAAWSFGLLALAEAARGDRDAALAVGRQATVELEEAVLVDRGVGYVLDRLREAMAALDDGSVVPAG